MDSTLTNNLVDLPMLKDWGNDEWRQHASCAGSDTTKFFPSKGKEANTQLVISNARIICGGCKVRKECLEFAVRNSIFYGIWGGLTREERKRVDLKDVERASKVSPNVVLGALRRLKVKNPINELAKILNMDVEEAREAVQNERNNCV